MPAQAASLQVERVPEAPQEQQASPATRPHTAPPAHATGTLRHASPSPPHSPSSSPTRRAHDRSAEWGGRSHGRSASAPGSPRRPDVLSTSRAHHDLQRLPADWHSSRFIRPGCCHFGDSSMRASCLLQGRRKARPPSGGRTIGPQLRVNLATAACITDTACCRRRCPCRRERPRAAIRCHGVRIAIAEHIVEVILLRMQTTP